MRQLLIAATVLAVCLITPGTCVASDPEDGSAWEQIAEGMQLGTFLGPPSDLGDSKIHILRMDPEVWKLRIIGISETGEENTYSPMRWCEEYGFAAAINAGMYAQDYSTHVGYMRSGSHVNASQVNHYKSLAVFGPRERGLPHFRIHDLDVDGTNVEGLARSYEYAVQNLRLIKRGRENRWSKQDAMWSEVALGEDRKGRILFIFCRTPYTMHEFNDVLLSLPIELECAQHLDGGPVAEMVILTEGTRREFIGSYESGCCEYTTNRRAYPLPNVLGVVRRDDK
jgi:hypothetical protein